MARWPDVPDVFGWLSLNAGGHWRLHAEGDALKSAGAHRSVPDGAPISSQRINQFINRNYASDAQGGWYFQNGPQRVYVRLDVAPFVLHTIDHELRHPVFLTHNGLRTKHVTRWCLDDAGHLYADTDLGPGLVASRDLEHVLTRLVTDTGDQVLDVLEQLQSDNIPGINVRWHDGSTASFQLGRFDQVPGLLGFVRYPGLNQEKTA